MAFFFVRTTVEAGTPQQAFLWLGRGLLGSVSNAAPYAHPSAANTAAVNFNKKMAKRGLPSTAFDIMPSKQGIPLRDDSPFTHEAPDRAVDPKAIEVHIVPKRDHVRILRIHGKYEVHQQQAKFNTKEEATEFANSVEEIEGV